MSLVGTRPPTVDEWEQYKPHHRARMAFRPGLTGLWQVSGRSNITNNFLLHRPYIVRFTIFTLLFVPSTKALLKSLATAF